MMRGGWLARGHVRKLILLCTYSPCTNCANIINDSAIINGVVYRHLTQHDTLGVDLLVNNGLDVVTTDELMNGSKDDLIGQWR
jgi:deoxycytidylate deaminase